MLDASRRSLLLGAGALGVAASAGAATNGVAAAAGLAAAPTAAAATAAASGGRDIRDYLLAGETLDPTGVRSPHHVLQRAVDALTAV